MSDPAPPSAPPPGTARLLVVDDNADNRDVLTRRLRRLGYTQLETAADGEAALAALAAASFDVVLLDVTMPRLDGVAVLSAMRDAGRLERTAVIMISASTELDTVVRCIALGAEDYLPKPFNPVLLQARLGAVLERQALRAEIRRQLDRMEQELAEARRQQLDMLPHEFPRGLGRLRVAVHAVMQPAREVGGDLYDCFAAGPTALCLAVGDVSDKGMPAALFMARTRSLLRASALQFAAIAGRLPRPAELLRAMNEELCKNNPVGMFVTLWLGLLDVDSGRLDYANAGHVLPWLMRHDGAITEIACRPGLPLGASLHARHTDETLMLAPGDALVVITDGLPEMMDEAGAFFSLDRVAATLAGLRGADAESMAERLVATSLAFRGAAPQADDAAALVVRLAADGEVA
ncbi:MAG TPA: fused response regulator/phosphatase [Acetobacteraceae bacterium]|nr:fused response regulator/phosphatase [Acetobacteraceae bacterium]